MMQQFIAVVLLPCMSVVAEPPGRAETVVYQCPETAIFLKREEGQYITPQEYASNAHLTDGHRDDRMPPEIKEAAPTQKVVSKSKKKKKHKRKKRRA